MTKSESGIDALVCASGRLKREESTGEGTYATSSREVRMVGEYTHPTILRPLALVHTLASRQLISAVSDEAKEAGIRVGLTLAQGRAVCPQLVHGPYDAEGDAKGLARLGRWMMRFSPVVSTFVFDHGEQGGLVYGLFLDVTGCARLFGGLHNLMEQVKEALGRPRIEARLAIAPSPGSAWALAFAGEEDGVIVRPEQLRSALRPLPPTGLRLEGEVLLALHDLGIKTIGQLMELPREALPARFGQMLLLRIDQALARVAEPLTALLHHEPVRAEMEFEGPIDSLETLWLACRELVGQVVEDLARRGCGARRMEIEFVRPDAEALTKTILLSAPTRNGVNLFNLIRCAMETLGAPAAHRKSKRWRRKFEERHSKFESSPKSKIRNPKEVVRVQGSGFRKRDREQAVRIVQDPEYASRGFIGIRLRVPAFEPLADEQVSFVEQEEREYGRALDQLVEQLCLRLGSDAVARVRMLESYVPEKAFAVCSVHDQSSKSVDHARLKLPRPLELLPAPIELRVMVSPSHDRDGRPVAFTLAQRTHRVIHAVGPERIAGQWWENHHKTRDYFDVEDEAGRRFWVFRVRENARWFLHGEFG